MKNRELLRNALWGLFGLALLATIVAALVARRQHGEPLAMFGAAPAFELTERGGELLGSRQLAGRPYVVDFFFTRCVLVCPTLTSRLARIGHDLEEGRDFRRVSVSVDPGHDTTAVLAEYAARFHAPATWWFLTGEAGAILRLSREGFHLGLEPATGDPANPISHSSRFVLVDGAGQIRGYYDALTQSEVDRLEGDLRQLVRLGGR